MKRFLYSCVAFVSVVLVAAFFSCDLLSSGDGDGGGGGGGGGTVTPGAELVETMNYTTSGSTIIMTEIPGVVTCYSYCDSLTLVQECDTSGGSDTSQYVLSGDTLKTLMDLDTLPSNAVVAYWMIAVRKGTGTGLQGVWTVTGATYQVLSGTPTQAELTMIQQELAYFSPGSGNTMEVQITANQVKLYEVSSITFAQELVMGLSEALDTSLFDLTVTVVNANTVKVKGNVTNEEVTITYNSTAETVTYTSSVAAHAAHVYYENPTTCPNDEMPPWLPVFLVGNMKTQTQKAPAVSIAPLLKRRKAPSLF